MTDEYDVVVVGGGVAGRSAAIFTARHDFETLVLDTGNSLLRRNSHLENYPGFPAGVNSRLLLDLMAEQADRVGAEFRESEVTRVAKSGEGFEIETTDCGRVRSTYVIAATKNEVSYLEETEGVGVLDRGKAYIDSDERGRTGVEGLYVAGRLAEKPHQTIICAGHGAEVAVTLLEDADVGFYHDWVAPEGYFTGRDREVPPGCEEIDESSRRRREDESLAVFKEFIDEPHPEEPEQHPNVEKSE